jgi:hypothetical protein
MKGQGMYNKSVHARGYPLYNPVAISYDMAVMQHKLGVRLWIIYPQAAPELRTLYYPFLAAELDVSFKDVLFYMESETL